MDQDAVTNGNAVMEPWTPSGELWCSNHGGSGCDEIPGNMSPTNLNLKEIYVYAVLVEQATDWNSIRRHIPI